MHTVIHDESYCNRSNYLYHGYLFVDNTFGREIVDKLIDIKVKYNGRLEEIHFKQIHGSSKYSKRTRIAVEWLKEIDIYIRNNKLKYYFFGINKNNVSNFWDNHNSFETNIYLKFFEIGLKSSIRWFEIPKISHIILDNSPHINDVKNKIQALSNEFFRNKFYNEVNSNNIIALDSKEDISGERLSNLIQLVDLLTGVCRIAFVSNKNKGQSECLNVIIDIIERFNSPFTAYRKGRYYKKFNLQFYPNSNKLTKEEFLNDSIDKHLKAPSFYCDRATQRQFVKLKEKKESEIDLFD